VVRNTRPDELDIEITRMHGGVAALAHGGRAEQATVAANKARVSSARWRWMRSLRRRRKRRRGCAPTSVAGHSGHGIGGGEETPNKALPWRD
jgi:hypothetical protein